MPIDDDLSMSLPQAPPPHPARREAAIEAALRRFDGADEEARPATTERPRRPSTPWWTRLRQPQFGLAVSAAIVAVVGVPATLIAIRDLSQRPAQEAAAPADSDAALAPPASATLEAPSPPSPVTPMAKVPALTPPPAAAPPALAQKSNSNVSRAKDELAESQSGSPPAAFAPPPPRAPQPAPVVAERGATQVATSNVIVTGTRIPQPSLERVARKASRDAAAAEAASADAAADSAYEAFVRRLQSAVRANDRSAVIKLVGFPLRVNSNGRSRSYPDARSVERDFNRIFTPRVRQSILAQRPNQLFTRDQGAMIGDGEVWFDYTCPNSTCTPPGPVRIKSVNP